MRHKLFFALFAAGLLFSARLDGASGKDALIFDITAALMAKDVMALARCFNVAGTEPETRQAVTKMLEDMMRWPAHQVTVSEREGSGRPTFTRNGRTLTLNGDWFFQVHIQRGAPANGGYVFPAGYNRNECLILLSVPEDASPPTAGAEAAKKTASPVKAPGRD